MLGLYSGSLFMVHTVMVPSVHCRNIFLVNEVKNASLESSQPGQGQRLEELPGTAALLGPWKKRGAVCFLFLCHIASGMPQERRVQASELNLSQ